MPSNGLSATDLRRPEHESGFFVRFKNRVRDLYAAEGVKATGINYEPRIAQQAMRSLLYEITGLTLFRRARPVSVRRHEIRRSRTQERMLMELSSKSWMQTSIQRDAEQNCVQRYL